MNPLVRSHDPKEMAGQLEGKGMPLWKWSEGGSACYFFASSRDCLTYLESDAFLSAVLLDDAGVLCLLPSGDALKTEKGLVEWCKTNAKVNFAELPQLLADFLLSGTGELASQPPGDLHVHLRSWLADAMDPLLARKAEIYSDALTEIVRAAVPSPKGFCKETPPDAEAVWGSSQVSDRAVAVASLSIAWAGWTPKQQELLVRLRDLFRGGRDGRGAGDLNKLKPRGGIVGMADDLLPRLRAKKPIESPVVERLQSYWGTREKDELIRLAHLVSLNHFLKLAPTENHSRLLESLWRTVRSDFNFGDRMRSLSEYSRAIQEQTIPALESAVALERRAKDVLGVAGIDFKENEMVVKAMKGFRALKELTDTCLSQPDRSGFPVLRPVGVVLFKPRY